MGGGRHDGRSQTNLIKDDLSTSYQHVTYESRSMTTFHVLSASPQTERE